MQVFQIIYSHQNQKLTGAGVDPDFSRGGGADYQSSTRALPNHYKGHFFTTIYVPSADFSKIRLKRAF